MKQLFELGGDGGFEAGGDPGVNGPTNTVGREGGEGEVLGCAQQVGGFAGAAGSELLLREVGKGSNLAKG